MVNIKGLSKAEVLLYLWKGSHAQGISILGRSGDFTIEDAKKAIEENPCLYFDYVNGRVIKCNLAGDEFDDRLYDHDCGHGRAEEVINCLKEGKPVTDEMSEEDDFIRCLLDCTKAEYDRKHKGERE